MIIWREIIWPHSLFPLAHFPRLYFFPLFARLCSKINLNYLQHIQNVPKHRTQRFSIACSKFSFHRIELLRDEIFQLLLFASILIPVERPCAVLVVVAAAATATVFPNCIFHSINKTKLRQRCCTCHAVCSLCSRSLIVCECRAISYERWWVGRSVSVKLSMANVAKSKFPRKHWAFLSQF